MTLENIRHRTWAKEWGINPGNRWRRRLRRLGLRSAKNCCYPMRNSRMNFFLDKSHGSVLLSDRPCLVSVLLRVPSFAVCLMTRWEWCRSSVSGSVSGALSFDCYPFDGLVRATPSFTWDPHPAFHDSGELPRAVVAVQRSGARRRIPNSHYSAV